MLYALWCAAIVFKGAAACRMAVNGIIRVLPLVFAYVFCTFLYLTLLLASTPFPRIYLTVYAVSVPLLLTVECSATASIFWTLTSNFVRLRMFGTGFLCVLTVAGAAAAWAISFLSPPVHINTSAAWFWSACLVAQRYVSATTVAFLAGVLFLHPRSRDISLPRFAIHAAWIMIFDATMRLISTTFMRLYTFKYPLISAFVPLTTAALTGLAWLTLRTYSELAVGNATPLEAMAQSGPLAFERHSIRSIMDQTIGMFRRGL
jgi:hypothetical protein